MENIRQTAEDLLKAIYRYYPIGVPAFKPSFWHAHVKEILEDKINGIINGVKNPWEDVVSLLKDRFHDKVLE